MTGILQSLQNLISSILGIFQSLLNTLFSSVQSLGAVFMTMVSSVLDLVRGLFNFLLSNIFIIGLLVAAVVGYGAYQQRQGRAVSGGKKTA